jgi:hypothetical protein
MKDGSLKPFILTEEVLLALCEEDKEPQVFVRSDWTIHFNEAAKC